MMNNLVQFFPNGFDASKYASKAESTDPPIIQAHKFLTSLGFKPPFIAKSQLMRFADKYEQKGGTAGWCIYNEIGDIGVMSYGSWHDGTNEVWSSANADYMSNESRAAYHDAIEASRRVYLAEKERVREAAAIECNRIWVDAPPAPDSHLYLQKKRIPAGIARTDGLNLILPMYLGDNIVGLQSIAPDGEKRFRKGSTKGYCTIGDLTGRILICEGYATAMSCHIATGFITACAFDAGNLFNTVSEIKAKYPGHDLTVCADNDETGIRAAEKIEQSLGVSFVLPPDEGTDFNDIDSGLARDIIAPVVVEEIKPKDRAAKMAQPHPHGALGLIADYYNATSGVAQYGFAVQTAIAIGSIVCGRNYKTDGENYASLFLMNVGKTATGKEHCKTVIEKVLAAANMDRLIVGDGFTSAGGVMSELLKKPRLITVIDEFGMYIEAANAKGNSMQKEANSYLMQAIGRCGGTIRAKNYSSMTLSKKDAESVQDRYVRNPAITMVGITTPSTFFENVTIKDVLSGFINRFVISISDAEPDIRRRVMIDAPPPAITQWIAAIRRRAENNGNTADIAVTESNPVILSFSKPAIEIQVAFEREMIGEIKRLGEKGLEGLAGRSNEMAMRLSLIMALSRDPNTSIVADIDMEYAVSYIRKCYRRVLDEIENTMANSGFESSKKEIYNAIAMNTNGISRTRMANTAPFSKHKPKDLDELLFALEQGDMIQKIVSSGRGRPTVNWRVTGR